MKEFVCFNSKYLPGYSLIDKSSARLRVPSQLISSLNSDGKSSSDSSSTSKSSGVAPKGSLMEMLQKNKSNFSSSSSSSSSSSKNCSKIHSFVKLKLFYQDKEEEKNIIIYATLWPDDQNALQENQTALDAVVFEGENIPEIMKNSNWFEGKIQVSFFFLYSNFHYYLFICFLFYFFIILYIIFSYIIIRFLKIYHINHALQ